MLKRIFSVLLFFSILLLSCSEPLQIEGFDSNSWKEDKYACAGIREKMQSDFENIRRDLYGRQEKEIKQLLGKPDSEELMARGQRMFYYYLEPGTQCEKRGQLSQANRAEVRFNALNKVSEITYARPIKK